MNEIESFIRDAAQKRGIDPDTAVKVAKSEGGVDEYARRGTFETGSSWWNYQLHYGGKGYEQFGTTAGMGTGFTALTGWQPGDPAAWRDSVRYALNRAKASGWGAWYGAAHVGVDQWDGIDRSVPWDAAAETWDYESGGTPVVATPAPIYDPTTPQLQQDDPWSCSCVSTWWGMTAYGRHPAEPWVETQMVADGIVSHEQGLLDASGAGLAAWITTQWGEFGYAAHNNGSVSFDDVVSVAGASPVLVGGRHWNHWSGVRRYSQGNDWLELANPADGWKGVHQTMTRVQFEALGPFSMVAVHWGGTEAPAGQPDTPAAPTFSVGEGLAAKMAAIGDVPASDETFLDLWSEAMGQSGVRYVYWKGTGEITLYPPST